jgi:hypothetical protein
MNIHVHTHSTCAAVRPVLRQILPCPFARANVACCPFACAKVYTSGEAKRVKSSEVLCCTRWQGGCGPDYHEHWGPQLSWAPWSSLYALWKEDEAPIANPIAKDHQDQRHSCRHVKTFALFISLSLVHSLRIYCPPSVSLISVFFPLSLLLSFFLLDQVVARIQEKAGSTAAEVRITESYLQRTHVPMLS